MVRPKQRKCLFVVFSDGTQYIAWDGTITGTKSKAARFATSGDAKEFVESKGITLNATTYIGQEDFAMF